MNTWFTSDTHFSHKNIIEYQGRSFSSVEDMNRGLIANWNSVVKKNDIVYHLGDFSLGGTFLEHFYRLNGIIHLIEGNHDNQASKHKEKFASYSNLKEISVNGQRITLCHYAMRTWNKQGKKAWSLYGHSHSNLPDDPNALSIDVGVDCHNYFPISFEQVQRIMNKKTFKPVDHHNERTT